MPNRMCSADQDDQARSIRPWKGDFPDWAAPSVALLARIEALEGLPGLGCAV